MANHSCCKGDPTLPEEPGWGDVLGTSQQCYSFVEYGCREDENYTVFPEFGERDCTDMRVTCIPNTETAANSNDVYIREFKRFCDGTRGNMCTGEMFELRDTWVECNECQTCQYGIETCVDLPSNHICDTNEKCTDGELTPYIDGTGPWKCQGACQGGQCNVSGNCACNETCGAECWYPDVDGYRWIDRQCLFDCMNHMSYQVDDCRYHADSGVDALICSSPNPFSPECEDIEIDGVEYTICPEDQSYTTPIDSEGFYISYCNVSDTCYTVSCTGNGTETIEGDRCQAAGTINDTLCFHSPTGQTKCNALDCEYAMNWTIECDTGNVEDGNCTMDNRCYMTQCSPTSGWTYSLDENILLGSTIYQCGTVNCRQGYSLKFNVCYYGIGCNSTGWYYTGESDISEAPCGSPTCTVSGWKC